MKKIAKIAVGLTLAASLTAGVAAFAGCSSTPDKTGEAYGLSHTGGFLAGVTIVTNGDTVKDLTITELCFPTYITVAKSGLEVGDEDKVGDYFKTVSYGDVTMTYDADSATYVIDGTPFAEYMQTEANVKAYFEAVMSNSVSVKVGETERTDVLTKAALSKDENGYWTRTEASGVWKTDATATDETAYSRWKMNRDATVDYVKTYGLKNLLNLEKTAEGEDVKEGSDVTYWTDGTVVTGATWSDLNSDTTGSNYYSYAQLIIKASEAAK